MIDKFIISNNDKLEPVEFIKLCTSVGWGKKENYTVESVKSALDKTNRIISARDRNNNIIGMARVLSDFVFTTYIAEIIILPEFQNLGIGTAIIEEIKNSFKGTGIFCETTPPVDKFLEKCGFTRRENMVVFGKRF